MWMLSVLFTAPPAVARAAKNGDQAVVCRTCVAGEQKPCAPADFMIVDGRVYRLRQRIPEKKRKEKKKSLCENIREAVAAVETRC